MTECCAITPNAVIEKKCDYVPPSVKNIVVRKTKKGEYQVRINGKGKWYHTDYDKETQKLIFSV